MITTAIHEYAKQGNTPTQYVIIHSCERLSKNINMAVTSLPDSWRRLPGISTRQIKSIGKRAQFVKTEEQKYTSTNAQIDALIN